MVATVLNIYCGIDTWFAPLWVSFNGFPFFWTCHFEGWNPIISRIHTTEKNWRVARTCNWHGVSGEANYFKAVYFTPHALRQQDIVPTSDCGSEWNVLNRLAISCSHCHLGSNHTAILLFQAEDQHCFSSHNWGFARGTLGDTLPIWG